MIRCPRSSVLGPRIVPMFVLLILISGCSFFSRSKSQIYSIERIAPATAVGKAGGIPVAIDAVELPPGLDRREIVVRQADHKLEVRSNQLWSASLQPAVLHTLAVDLAGRLPDGMVILPGQAKPVSATHTIEVVFEELGAGPELAVTLDARWVLKRGGAAAVNRHERITIEIASLESGQIAAGLSRAIAELADRIASSL